MPGIKEKAISGVRWTTIEQVATMVLQFVIGIIVARLVDPSDYGLIAMLGIFISFGNIFVNSGFGIALIRKKDVTLEDYSTAFFFNIIIGLIVYVILFITAPIIARFYDTPLLEEITRYYTLTILINSFSIVQIAKLTHELRFRIQFLINLTALFVSGTLGIVLAYKGFGVWALVWQGLSASIIKTLLYIFFSKWKPLLLFSRNSFRYLFSFGSKLLVTNLIDTVYDNIYTLVIGKYYSAKSAGYYNRSLQMAQLPQNVVSQVVAKVALPVLTPYQEDNKKLLQVYEKMFRLTVFVSYPLMILMTVLAEPIILILLGEKWLPSVPYMQILTVSVIFVVLTLINLNLFFVKGRSGLVLKIDIYKKIVGFGVVILMIPLGLKWICVGTIIYAMSAFVINCSQTKKILNYGLIPQLKAAAPSLLYSIIMGAIVFYIIKGISNPYIELVVGGIVGVLAYIIIALIMRDKTLLDIISIIKERYGKR